MVRALSMLAIVAVLAIAGCTGNSGHDVQATVKFEDGSPVPYGMVRFVNDSYETFGNINDGVVEIGDADGGVPPGVYKIAVQATIDEGEKRGESIIKTKYASVNTSGLEITVEENKSIDIVVEKP